MSNKESELIQKFLATISIPSPRVGQLFVVSFIGLTGTGKSHIAEMLSKELGIYTASNDRIRRFLETYGFTPGAAETQKVVRRLAESTSHYLYQHHISHILDADLIEYSDLLLSTAAQYQAKVYIIHIVCPEDIVLERLQKRTQNITAGDTSNSSRAGKELYVRRKLMHSAIPLPVIFATIDSSLDIDIQLSRLVIKLRIDLTAKA